MHILNIYLNFQTRRSNLQARATYKTGLTNGTKNIPYIAAYGVSQGVSHKP